MARFKPGARTRLLWGLHWNALKGAPTEGASATPRPYLDHIQAIPLQFEVYAGAI